MAEFLPRNQILIKKLTEIILANLGNENFGVKELAQESGLGRYSLNRKLLAATQKTVSQFIRETRLRKAMEMLKNEDLTASEVAYKTGFSSPNYFNTCFHEFFGYPPGKVKKGDSENPDEDLVAYFTSRQKQKKLIRHTFPFYKARIPSIFVLIVTVGILFYLKIFRHSTTDDLRSSDGKITIAVMPFQNMTNDTACNIWQDIIQVNLISSLSNFPEELEVRQTESINNLLANKGLTNYSSITPSAAAIISRKLNANVFILGSIQQEGSQFRLNAILINSKTKGILKSFEIDEPNKEEIDFDITDSLRMKITDFLILSKLIKDEPQDLKPFTPIKSPEAYRYFIYGNDAFRKYDFITAISWFSRAIDIDPDWIMPNLGLINSYGAIDMFEEAKKWCMHLYEKKEQMMPWDKIYTNWVYANYFGTPNEEIKYLRQYLEIDGQDPISYFMLGESYNELYLYEKAIPEYEKSLEIYNKWDSKPNFIIAYSGLGIAYHKTRQYKKEEKLYRKAERDFPDDPVILFRQAILSLTERDTVAANQYIEKYIFAIKADSLSDADIAACLGFVYLEGGIPREAENYYRKALSFEPDNPLRLNALAYFLIDNGQNINEGMGLIEKALVLSPDRYDYLETKGWGLYKQGKYRDASEILEKGWDLRKEQAVYNYNHNAYLHLEAAKKAVDGQKNN